MRGGFRPRGRRGKARGDPAPPPTESSGLFAEKFGESLSRPPLPQPGLGENPPRLFSFLNQEAFK